MNRTRKIIVTIWVLAGLSLLTLLGCLFGGLGFADEAWTAVTERLASFMPAVCLVLLGFLPRSRARIWSFICLGAAAPIFFVAGSIAVFSQTAPVKTQQASVHFQSSRIVTYFVDTGAWDNGEVVVQQEVPLLPGLLWVKPLSRQECLRDVKIKVINRHYVECDYVADTVDKGDPSPDAKRDVAWVF